MNPTKQGGKVTALRRAIVPKPDIPDDHIYLQKQDIYGAYWKAGKLTIHTKQGGLVFGCVYEQWQASQALKSVGIPIAEPPLTTAQKWLKACHHLVNHQYFAGKLSTPYFVIADNPYGYEAWYNGTRRVIGFSESAYKNGFDNVARWAYHTLIHEATHQYVDEVCGVQPVKGLDSHLEPTFQATCSVIVASMLGIVKTDWTLAELRTFPQCLIHDDYYQYRTDELKLITDWR